MAEHQNNCAKCGGPLQRDEKHDAYFCAACDSWREKKCSDPECEFCAGRPERPSQVVA